MKPRSLLFVATLLPLVSFAQSNGAFQADVSAGAPGMPAMPGMNLSIRVNDSATHSEAHASAHQEETRDGYRITWDTDPEGGTWFKILAPENLPVTVIDDRGNTAAAGVIPVSFRAKGKRFYQVAIQSSAGVFARKFEAKHGMVAQLWVQAPGPVVQQQVVVEQPVPQPAQPMPVASPCGPEGDLQAVSGAIRQEDFSDGKLRVLGDAAEARGFCVAHAVQLLGLFDFENDKLKALQIMAPRLTDPENKFKIYSAFTFDSSRAQARQILH